MCCRVVQLLRRRVRPARLCVRGAQLDLHVAHAQVVRVRAEQRVASRALQQCQRCPPLPAAHPPHRRAARRLLLPSALRRLLLVCDGHLGYAYCLKEFVYLSASLLSSSYCYAVGTRNTELIRTFARRSDGLRDRVRDGPADSGDVAADAQHQRHGEGGVPDGARRALLRGDQVRHVVAQQLCRARRLHGLHARQARRDAPRGRAPPPPPPAAAARRAARRRRRRRRGARRGWRRPTVAQ